MAKSIMDYIFGWLVSKFLDGDAPGPAPKLPSKTG